MSLYDVVAQLEERRQTVKLHLYRRWVQPPPTPCSAAPAHTHPPHSSASVLTEGASKIDAVKLATAVSDTAQDTPEWKNAGKVIEPAAGFGKEGLQVWRIENFHVVTWPTEQYGKFFSGDSYIILYTYEVNGKRQYNVHYWIGLGSSQDEYGTAAYKTVRLVLPDPSNSD